MVEPYEPEFNQIFVKQYFPVILYRLSKKYSVRNRNENIIRKTTAFEYIILFNNSQKENEV